MHVQKIGIPPLFQSNSHKNSPSFGKIHSFHIKDNSMLKYVDEMQATVKQLVKSNGDEILEPVVIGKQVLVASSKKSDNRVCALIERLAQHVNQKTGLNYITKDIDIFTNGGKFKGFETSPKELSNIFKMKK